MKRKIVWDGNYEWGHKPWRTVFKWHWEQSEPNVGSPSFLMYTCSAPVTRNRYFLLTWKIISAYICRSLIWKLKDRHMWSIISIFTFTWTQIESGERINRKLKLKRKRPRLQRSRATFTSTHAKPQRNRRPISWRVKLCFPALHWEEKRWIWAHCLTSRAFQKQLIADIRLR